MRIVNTTLQNQIITMSFILTGMSVANIQGIEADKNNISDIHNIAITNFEIKSAFAAIIAGTYISAKVIALAFATNIGSGSLSKAVIG